MRQSLAVVFAMALLAVGITAGVVAIASSGGRGAPGEAPGSQPVATSTPATTAPEAATSKADATRGKAVFASAGCGGCHALDAADASGSAGPDLDTLKPSFDDTVDQVTEGGGGMPAFGDSLSEQEILDVAAFVATAASGR